MHTAEKMKIRPEHMQNDKRACFACEAEQKGHENTTRPPWVHTGLLIAGNLRYQNRCFTKTLEWNQIAALGLGIYLLAESAATRVGTPPFVPDPPNLRKGIVFQARIGRGPIAQMVHGAHCKPSYALKLSVALPLPPGQRL